MVDWLPQYQTNMNKKQKEAILTESTNSDMVEVGVKETAPIVKEEKKSKAEE